MGNCLAFQLNCDQAVNGIVRCLSDEGYIRTLKKNLRSLEREMEDLRAIQDQVQNRVAREVETRHRQRLEIVKVWLERVDSIDIQFNDVLSTRPDELQKLCFGGLCSRNVCSSYKYGKRVFLLLEEVKILKSEGNFEVVVEPAPISEVEVKLTPPTVGQEEMLKTAWNRLMEVGVGIMGLHGMGGVGKTTLFKKINNKFAEIAGRFDVVIWVVVSQGVKISMLQEDIAKQIRLFGEEWKNKNESDKASDIYRVLMGKRFVLMLDDIWEKVDLVAIGVPFPTRDNGCKVAFTTRSRDVCGSMGDHEPMEVKCLEWKKAWELFKNKVGDKTLSPDIVEQAKMVAKKCRGLPLALNVIGETMAAKTTVHEWDHAINVLTRSAAEFSNMDNKILPILKFSYDSLVDEHIKLCFLYCALFPEDYKISKENLIDYWICEGCIGEDDQDIKDAMNQGYDVLGTLIRAHLVMEANTYAVVMHDVVREMALWIASDFGKQKEAFVVQARVGLRKIPKVKDWGAVRRMSLMNNNIEEITCASKCSELTTLFLQNNRSLKNLSGEFIQSMQKLVVLDLSGNDNLNELPEQISELASLQFLDLSFTSIEQLPVGFQELKKLTHLNFTYTDRLCSISGISKLSSLRILKIIYSKVHGDVSLLKELQLLEHLQVLRITISTELGLEQILGDQRLANCITGLHIKDFRQKPFNISLLAIMKNLSQLGVENSRVLDIKCRESFSNLSSVVISRCNGIKDLTWLLFAPNLVNLLIGYSDDVEEIINKEKAINLTGIAPFQKLEILELALLPKLESIYWSPLPFPFLKHITAFDCPKLRKLPLNATSVPRLEEFKISIYPVEQKTELEWEDEDTKNRFLPLVKEAMDIKRLNNMMSDHGIYSRDRLLNKQKEVLMIMKQLRRWSMIVGLE